MRSGCEKSSLDRAERIYNCPFLYITRRENSQVSNGDQGAVSFKTQETRLRRHIKSQIKCKGDEQKKPPTHSISTKKRPKKDDELSCKQQERLQQLLSVYAEQSSHSFRPTARNVGELPKLVVGYERKRTVLDTSGKNPLKDVLPKLTSSETNGKKRRASKSTDVHFPSIIME